MSDRDELAPMVKARVMVVGRRVGVSTNHIRAWIEERYLDADDDLYLAALHALDEVRPPGRHCEHCGRRDVALRDVDAFEMCASCASGAVSEMLEVTDGD